MKGRFVGGSGSSGGTNEDCPPVNKLNTSNMERTTAGLKEGGSLVRKVCWRRMSASTCALGFGIDLTLKPVV